MARRGETRIEMRTTRLEAFSDGVFAIATTLLVLNLQIPKGSKDLATALGDQWPVYAAYAIGFLTIGIVWINHHAIFDHVKAVDRTTLFLNLLFLLVIAVIPFPTALLAEYLRDPGGSGHLAALVFAASMTAMALLFFSVWLHISRTERLGCDLGPEAVRTLTLQYGIGTAVYALAIPVALVSAVATLVIYAGVLLFYVTERIEGAGSPESRSREPERG